MMVKETAKLENAPIPRLSSWAYPISWSFSVSVFAALGAASPVLAASSISTPFPPNG